MVFAYIMSMSSCRRRPADNIGPCSGPSLPFLPAVLKRTLNDEASAADPPSVEKMPSALA